MTGKKRETRAESAPEETRAEDVYVADKNAQEQEEASRGDVTNVSEMPDKHYIEMTPKEYANRFKTVQKYLRENAPPTAPAGGDTGEEKGDGSSE